MNNMHTYLKRNIDIAIDLMDTPIDYEDYISFKIKPTEEGCCCLNNWSITWDTINKYIYPNGPVKNEGAVVLDKNKMKLVLECHESGPEIIAYLGLGTASIILVKSIIDLIVTVLKARQNESHSGTFKNWKGDIFE